MAVPPHKATDDPDGVPSAWPGTRSVTMVDGRIDSGDLLVGTREIVIRHRDESYRLRLTALNKLILMKLTAPASRRTAEKRP